MPALVKLRANLRRIAWAVLPALVLRALTPMGFMPMHDTAGNLYFAFCPGVSDAVIAAPAAEHAHHQHHGGAKQDPRHHDLCPYALSAGPALAHAVPVLAESQERSVAAPAPFYSPVSLPTIERAQSARAPPAPRVV